MNKIMLEELRKPRVKPASRKTAFKIIPLEESEGHNKTFPK